MVEANWLTSSIVRLRLLYVHGELSISGKHIKEFS